MNTAAVVSNNSIQYIKGTEEGKEATCVRMRFRSYCALYTESSTQKRLEFFEGSLGLKL